MAITVRRLTADDWAVLREIRLRALLDTPEAFLRTHAEESAFDEARWRGRLSRSTVTILADLDGLPVGMVSGVPAGEDEGDPAAAMMVGMWVDPAARGKGVAEALTEELLAWARAGGYLRMVLWVYDVNPRAAAFYRRFGFVPTGRSDSFLGDPRVLRLLTMPLFEETA